MNPITVQKGGLPAAVEVPVPATAATEARAVFLAPPDFHEAASVFVRLGEPTPAGRTVSLLYDYDDLKPQPGWVVVVAGKTYEVTAAAGRALECREAPPARLADDPQTF